MASLPLQDPSSYRQSKESMEKLSLKRKRSSENSQPPAAPASRTLASKISGLDIHNSKAVTVLEGGEYSSGRRGFDLRPQNTVTGSESSNTMHANETTTQDYPNTDTQGSQARVSGKNTGHYWPIQRVWQITPQLTETIKVQSISPMARWEQESMREESWNAIGEVFIDHPVNWSQEPADSEEGDVDLGSAAEGSVDDYYHGP